MDQVLRRTYRRHSELHLLAHIPRAELVVAEGVRDVEGQPLVVLRADVSSAARDAADLTLGQTVCGPTRQGGTNPRPNLPDQS